MSEIIVTANIDEKMNKVLKNIEYCRSKGLEDALKEGGKWHKAFEELVNQIVEEVKNEVQEDILMYVPDDTEVVEDHKWKLGQLFQSVTEGLTDIVRSGKIEKLSDFIKSMEWHYCNTFVQ